MTTIWERLQKAAKAARDAWNGVASGGAGDDFYTDLDAAQRNQVALYARAWSYYSGEMHRPLRVRANQPDDNVIINHARRIVDKGVAFLFGPELRWELTDGETTPEEEALDAAWGDVARRMAFLSDVATTGAICGVYHVQIVARPATENAPTQPPRLINLYPGIVFPHWLPGDVDTILAYELRFRAGADTARTIYTLDDETRTAWSTWQEKLTRRGWEVTTKPQAWPYAWPPIVTGKNLPNPHSFYGLSDLQDIDLNDSINFVASNINRILRIHAHPRLWSTGLAGKELSNDPDKIPNLPQGASLNTVAAQAGMTSSVEHMRALTTALYEVCRVPEMNPQDMSLGAQSGFALQVLHSDLLAKTETKRRLYGAMIVELNRRVLELMGYGSDNRVTLHWSDALPADVRQEIAALTFDANQELASKQTLMAKRGYDFETEQERRAAEEVEGGRVGGRILDNFMNGRDGQQL